MNKGRTEITSTHKLAKGQKSLGSIRECYEGKKDKQSKNLNTYFRRQIINPWKCRIRQSLQTHVNEVYYFQSSREYDLMFNRNLMKAWRHLSPSPPYGLADRPFQQDISRIAT